MCDIGDMDLQFEVAVFELMDGDGVVKITGGFAIDSDYGDIAEVAARCGLHWPG